MTRAATLHDGSRVLVRRIEPGDRELLAEGYERLSPPSRYRRFFAPKPHLSERDLDYVTQVDHHGHEARALLERLRPHARDAEAE